jgi:hypothetical protein
MPQSRWRGLTPKGQEASDSMRKSGKGTWLYEKDDVTRDVLGAREWQWYFTPQEEWVVSGSTKDYEPKMAQAYVVPKHIILVSMNNL